MSHLIETIYDLPINKAIIELEKTYSLIVERAISIQKNIETDSVGWGVRLKRLEVPLPVEESLIGKASERFVEIINILATTERTISALKWFLNKYPESILKECHSSTSDDAGGNDIVITDNKMNIIARCEVTDVISSNASQNGKEKNDLKNLGCAEKIPDDQTSRYIATSKEFANALTSPKRKWRNMHYQYIKHETDFQDQTTLLEIISKT